MPTETGTIDLKAQKAAYDDAESMADDAAKVATDYITEISQDGIWVTPSDAKPSSGSAIATTSGWHISDAIELFKSGVSYIKMWVESNVAKLRLGATTSTHVVIDNDSLDIEDSSSNTLATFAASGAEIGDKSKAWLRVNNKSISLMNSSTPIIDLGFEEGWNGGAADVHGTIGSRLANSTIGGTSLTVGYHAEASASYAISFGSNAVASGTASQAMGWYTEASNTGAFSAGVRNVSSGAASFTSGQFNTASGESSHAEGIYCTSSGQSSHAQNTGTEAASASQTAIGKYNVSDSADTYALIVGNGTGSSARSNALTVDWNGNVAAGNTLTLGTNTSAEENGIKIKGGGSRNQYALRVISASNGDGDAVLLGDGGLTIIGAGEAAPSLWTDLNTSAGSENLHLAADSSIYLHSNCQTIASRKTATYDTSGNLTIPAKIVASKLEPPTRTAGVSYIAGANGDASVYTKKSTGNIWSPAICLDTTSGGSWQIGNYNNENLQFVWASKSNRDSNTNTTTAVNLPNTAGTISLQPVYYSASSATQVNVTDTSKFRFLVILFRTNSTTYTGNGTSADSSPLNSTMVHINNKSSGNVYASLIGGHQVSTTMVQFRMGIATVTCSTTAGKVTLSKQMYCNIDSSSQAVASNTDMALVGVVGIY